MNRTLRRAFLIATPIAAISLSGCAYSSYDYPYANPYNVAYATPAYYDGYYGPYWDGYWGPDGFFHFFDVDGKHFRRDDGHHFRHDMAPGFAGVPHGNVARGMHPSHTFGQAGGGTMREHRG